jgi:transcriptional/translational regulatory protein YebC/TACO1
MAKLLYKCCDYISIVSLVKDSAFSSYANIKAELDEKGSCLSENGSVKIYFMRAGKIVICTVSGCKCGPVDISNNLAKKIVDAY